MRPASIDPAPRRYPDAVTLVRRAAVGRAAAPEHLTIAEVENWLLGEAVRISDLITLFEAFVWRMVSAGLPLDRASLHVGTLHPQLFGFAWNWNVADGLCDEVKVAETALASDAYRRNPLAVVLEKGEAVSLDPADPSAGERFPLTADLRELGITHYLALPLGGAGYHNVATVATRQVGGFSDVQRATLEQLLRLLALHVERHIAMRIARNVLDTYLGSLAGGRVLEGSIKRGAGTRVEAAVWSSDLRGFTDMADRLEPPVMLAVLNVYFEAMAGAVIRHGGEVLKFMGDGLLAIFPLDGDYPEGNAASAALAAALAAEASVERLNRAPPYDLATIDGWRPLRSGIALHVGDVFFGNIGAPERLDFTVIGAAVNAVSRVEGMSKQLGHSILFTAEVARHLSHPSISLGTHSLRGVGEPMEIFALDR
jgi:adenylate cyclase